MPTELLTSESTEPFAQTAASPQKKCPFCAEFIQDEAIKCRYCGEFLDGSNRMRSTVKDKEWYFSNKTVALALLCLGPFALPLVWFNPYYKPFTKGIISLIVLTVTLLCFYLMNTVYQQMSTVYQQMTSQLQILGI